MSNLVRLKEAVAEKTATLEKMFGKAKEEKRGLTLDEQPEWQKIKQEIENDNVEIRGLELLETFDPKKLSTPQQVSARNPLTMQDYDYAIRAIILSDTPNQRKEFTDACDKVGWNTRNKEIPEWETRDMSTLVVNHGKELVPTSLAQAIYEVKKEYGGLRPLMGTLPSSGTSSKGGPYRYPRIDDTANVGTVKAQGSGMSVIDIQTDDVLFSSVLIASGIQKLSVEMVQDTEVPIIPVVARLLGIRLARKEAQLLVDGTGTGTGTSQEPEGLLTNAISAVTTASASAITEAEIKTLYYSVAPAYGLNNPNACWITSMSGLALLDSLQDGNDRDILRASLADGFPFRLLGHPLYVVAEMPAATAGLCPIAFGAIKDVFFYRDVSPVQTVNFNERYMDTLSVGVAAYLRMDSRNMNYSGVKKITMHA